MEGAGWRWRVSRRERKGKECFGVKNAKWSEVGEVCGVREWKARLE